MDRHIRILGYLFIAWGILLALFVVVGPLIPGVFGVRPDVGYALLGMILSAIVAAFYMFAGWSLLTRQPYARTLTIAASILALFNFPLGTVLGIYGLWVSFSAEGRREFGVTSGTGIV